MWECAVGGGRHCCVVDLALLSAWREQDVEEERIREDEAGLSV